MPSITQIAHEIILHFIKPNMTLIDATCGRGKDTLFLLENSDNCIIHSYDIQLEAINSAKRLLGNRQNEVIFHHESHEKINYPFDCAVFNLGYLPHGDKCITTKVGSTLSTLANLLTLAKSTFLILIVVYPGHPEGLEESLVLLDYTRSLDAKIYKVFVVQPINQANSPYIIAITSKYPIV